MQTDNETLPDIGQIVNDLLLELDKDGSNTRRMVTRLNKLHDNVLCLFTSEIDPLAIFNPRQNSLPYMYFITARCLHATNETAPHLLLLLHDFIRQMIPSALREADVKVSNIHKALLHLATKLNNPLIPVLPLMMVIRRLEPSKNTLTVFHAPLAKACLLARTYRQPLVILDHDIENVGQSSDIRSFLEYHYYGAMIYIGNRAFDRALDFLSLVISAPTADAPKTISAIQLEAYKKYALVSLIHDGRLRPLPKYTSTPLQKEFKERHKTYVKMTEAFEQTNITRFTGLLEEHQQVLNADKHVGLAKQCIDALYEKKISELSSVYITLKMKDLSSKLGQSINEDDTERILLHMVEKGRIAARITYLPEDHVKVVLFHDDARTRASALTSSLDQRILRAANVNAKLSKIDQGEGKSKQYQQKLLAAKGRHLAPAPTEEPIDAPIEEDTEMLPPSS